MAQEPGWELYRTLLAVLDEGSLSAASRALGLAQPTVGRHVDALEEALGLTLFMRTPQGLQPTPAALTLQPHAQAIASAAATVLRVASSQGARAGESVAGTVRLTASEVIGVEVLPPLLARLRAAHPRLVVELVLSNRVQDLLRREADVAVRMVRPKQQSLVARRVGAIELGLHAHRDYLARAGHPKRESELAEHALVGFDAETAFIRSLAPCLPGLRREAFALRSDSDLAQLAAIRAGVGIGMCQVPIARRDPSLVRLLARRCSLSLECWVTLHEDLRDQPACRVVVDALVKGLAAHIALQTVPAASRSFTVA